MFEILASVMLVGIWVVGRDKGESVMDILFGFDFMFFAIPVIWWIGKELYIYHITPSAEETAARRKERTKRENEETEARLLNKAIDEERRRRLAEEIVAKEMA